MQVDTIGFSLSLKLRVWVWIFKIFYWFYQTRGGTAASTTHERTRVRYNRRRRGYLMLNIIFLSVERRDEI